METIITQFEPGFIYYAKHIPSGEEWYLLGINVEKDKVCAAGWPPSLGKLSDCYGFEKKGKISEHELNYRNSQFGNDWL